VGLCNICEGCVSIPVKRWSKTSPGNHCNDIGGFDRSVLDIRVSWIRPLFADVRLPVISTKCNVANSSDFHSFVDFLKVDY
jgi:hypothetical protein